MNKIYVFRDPGGYDVEIPAHDEDEAREIARNIADCDAEDGELILTGISNMPSYFGGCYW